MHEETAWLIGIFFVLCGCFAYLLNSVGDLRETAKRIEKLLEKDRRP